LYSSIPFLKLPHIESRSGFFAVLIFMERANNAGEKEMTEIGRRWPAPPYARQIISSVGRGFGPPRVVALLSHSRESLSREEGGMEMDLKPSVPNLGSAGRFTVAAFAITALLWAATASADSIEGQVLGAGA